MSTSGWPVISPGRRVGDAERSAVCDRLGAGFAAGQLSAADLEHRLDQAVSATTQRDLVAVVSDLGPLRPEPVPGRPSTGPRPTAVVAVLLLLGSLAVAGSMLLLLGFYSFFLFLAAGVGGAAAAVGGAAATHLVHQAVRSRPDSGHLPYDE